MLERWKRTIKRLCDFENSTLPLRFETLPIVFIKLCRKEGNTKKTWVSFRHNMILIAGPVTAVTIAEQVGNFTGTKNFLWIAVVIILGIWLIA